MENFKSSFKEKFGNEVKAVELLPHDVPRFKQPVKVKFEALSEENVVYIQKVDPTQPNLQLLEVWRAYPAKAKDNQVALTLTSFSIAFVSEATDMFQIEDTKGEEDDSVVFAKIKSGINAIIQNCTKGCPVGPQLANWGYKIIDFRAMQNCLCACVQPLD